MIGEVSHGMDNIAKNMASCNCMAARKVYHSPMNTQERITQHLEREFAPSHLDIQDESAGHRGGEGAQSHFRVVLISDVFAGQPLIKRHRAVNACLADELAAGVHALALHTYTPQEWQARSADARPSPACAGKP